MLLGKYQYTKLIVDLSLKLTQMYQVPFIPESELRLDMDYEGVGYRGHLCDGVLEFDDKRIAIEVELTTKGRRRLRKIITSYLADFSIHEVWYFCGSKEVMNLVESQAQGNKFIQTFLLRDWVG